MFKASAVLCTVFALAAVAFASTTIGPSAIPAARPAPGPVPSARSVTEAGNAGPVVHWEHFYDRNGNPLPDREGLDVGAESLFFKKYNQLNDLYGCPKAQVPNPNPGVCRSGFSFLHEQTVAAMDPAGTYIYEVHNTTLRRHSTTDGSHTDYTISNGYQGCATDGQFVYAPVDNVVYKYTLDGTLVSSTTISITPIWYEFSVANDTLWCGADNSTMSGYACARFAGGSITADATWDVGSGSIHPSGVAWDGQYYYVIWLGSTSNTFKRFNPNRTLSASGTAAMDPRGLFCRQPYRRQTSQDSLYWKSFYSATDIYSSPKAQDVTPAQPTPIPWQDQQSVPGMTPDGHYLFEVNGTNLRRTDLRAGAVINYTLGNGSYGSCGCDAEFVYVPSGTTVRKYTLDGGLVSATTTNHQPIGGGNYGFGVANDTVWFTDSYAGTTWYGYACSKFAGGSITHDATWTTDGDDATAMNVAFDGQYYYMCWGGHSDNKLMRFYRDRTLYSSGTTYIDSRGVWCKAICPLMIVSTDEQSLRVELAETLRVTGGGVLDRVGTYSVQSNATFPATEWYNDGCRVILEFSGGPIPSSPVLIGDSLARFVDLGGRVVTTMWADHSGNLAGRFVNQYMPFTMQTQTTGPDSLGLVHDPIHPLIDGVTALSVTNYITGNTHSTLRSPNCVCLAEWTTGNRAVAAYLDSAGVRLASLGYVPFRTYSGGTGQWAKLLANAILWVGPWLPAVGVTAPATGNFWYAGGTYDIAWTADNGPIVKDSVVYSQDNGASWDFVDTYVGSRTSCAWTVPNTPSTDCYVRVFTWNAQGRAFGNSGKFEIRVPVRDVGVTEIIQPRDTVDSGTVVTPTAAVENSGQIGETFTVRLIIGSTYTMDTVVTLDAGVTDTVSFPQWTAGPVGTVALRCSTRLAEDGNNANDRWSGSVVVKSLGGVEENGVLPLTFALRQLSPNPTATGAHIRYDLPRPARVELSVYDASGARVRRLVDEVQVAGYREACWNRCDERGRTVAPGVYYCRFEAGGCHATQKLVVRR